MELYTWLAFWMMSKNYAVLVISANKLTSKNGMVHLQTSLHALQWQKFDMDTAKL